MRYLDFKAEGQSLVKIGDHENLVAGTEGYLYARFNFSEEWAGTKKIVTMEWNGCTQFVPLVSGNSFQIPAECLKYNRIYLCVEGRKGGYRIKTNKAVISQTGGING